MQGQWKGQTLLFRALPRWVSKTSRGGDCITSWGNLLRCPHGKKRIPFFPPLNFSFQLNVCFLSSCHHSLLWRAWVCRLDDLLVARADCSEVPAKPSLLQAGAAPSLRLPLQGWCSSPWASWWPSTGLALIWQCLSPSEEEEMMQFGRCRLTAARWRRIITSLDLLLAVLLFTQPMVLLASTAAGAHDSLLSTKSASSFSVGLLPTWSILSLYHCRGFFLPRTGFCICPGRISHSSCQPIPPARLDLAGRQPCPWAYWLVPPDRCYLQTSGEYTLPPPGHWYGC